MKLLSAAISIAALYSSCYAALDEPNLAKRAGTCSLGIGRQFADIYWDVTVYDTTQPLRQDVNIIATLRNAKMDKGESISVSWPPHTLNITNVDNAPVLAYDVPELRAPIAPFETGATKVTLQFQIPDAKLNWTTEDCGASSVVFSAGREGWSCEFPCP